MMKDSAREQVIALAGVWQAANLVYDIAHLKELDRQQKKRFDCSLNSLLVVDAKESAEVYGTIDNLQLSMLSLYGVIKRSHKSKPNVLMYVVHLIRLQQMMTKNSDMSSYLGQEIRRLSEQKEFYQEQQTVLIENLARIYSETFGSLPMRNRIKVQGVPEILQKVDIQNAVRATLLAGIRSVVLWRQMNGTRWQLLLNRHRLERALAELVTYGH